MVAYLQRDLVLNVILYLSKICFAIFRNKRHKRSDPGKRKQNAKSKTNKKPTRQNSKQK